MATKVNEILQFASQDTGSNLLTQAEYDGDAQRVIGHQPGIARSRLENKVLRQCSTMAAGLAEFVLQNQDGSVTDSMTKQEIADALSAAVSAISGASGSVSLQKSTTTPTFTPNSAALSYVSNSSYFDMFTLSIGGEDRLAVYFGRAYLQSAQTIAAKGATYVTVNSTDISRYNYGTGFANNANENTAYSIYNQTNPQQGIRIGLFLPAQVSAGVVLGSVYYGGILVKWD